MQPEGRQRAHGLLEAPARDQLAAVQQQRVAHQREVGEQLGGADVVAPGLVAAARRQARARVEQLLAHAGELQPVGLLGVQAPVALVELGQALEVGGQRGLQLGRDARDAHRGGEVGAQLVDDRQRVAQRVGVLELQDVERGRRQHVGVAVAVAADPAAEAQRASVDREVDAEAGELVDQRLERVGHRVAVQLVEVVDGVARLVDDVGLGHAQLVALPQQLDELLEPALDAALRGVAHGPLALVEQGGDLAQLGQHRAPRGLGGVGGEHGAHREVRDVRAQLAGRDRGARDPLDGLRQPRAALDARGLELAGAVDLLGHVGQVEVGREGAHEADRRERIDLGEDGGGGVAVRAHEPAHALDEIEHLAPLLAHDRAPQQHAELADVAAQRSLGLVPGGGGALGEHRWPAW